MKMSKLFLTALFLGLVSLAVPGFAAADTDYEYTYTEGYGSYALSFTTDAMPVVGGGPTTVSAADLSFASVTGYALSGDITSVVLDAQDPECLGYGNPCSIDVNLSSGEQFDSIANWSVVDFQTPGTYYGGLDDTLTVTAVQTPEPCSMLLLSGGLVGLGFIKRKVFQS